jgi:hypothetical protein
MNPVAPSVQEALTVTPEQAFTHRFLNALARKGTHIYEGTVPAHVKARRRARAKVAKASRKANR